MCKLSNSKAFKKKCNLYDIYLLKYLVIKQYLSMILKPIKTDFALVLDL